MHLALQSEGYILGTPAQRDSTHSSHISFNAAKLHEGNIAFETTLLS